MSEETGGPERLRVYALAQDLGVEIDGIIRRELRGQSIADQLNRALESVLLNIAEGAAHYSPGRKIYHYQTAHGSASECIAALTRLERRRPTPAVRSARRTANMICIMLTALIHAQERRRDRSRGR